MLPDRLASQVAYLQAQPSVSILGGQVEVFNTTGKVHQVTSHPAEVTAETVSGMLASSRGIWLLNHPAVIFRREAILAIGGYPEVYRRCQDLALWLRALKAGLTIRNQAETVGRYRIHSQQLTGQRGDVRAEHDAIVAREWTV